MKGREGRERGGVSAHTHTHTHTRAPRTRHRAAAPERRLRAGSSAGAQPPVKQAGASSDRIGSLGKVFKVKPETGRFWAGLGTECLSLLPACSLSLTWFCF